MKRKTLRLSARRSSPSQKISLVGDPIATGDRDGLGRKIESTLTF